MLNPIFDAILAQGVTKMKTEKQQKIIETAIKLFSEKGYSNTSTAEIAKIAGVSEGTIFKHYGTKDKLLLSVILPFVKDFFPSMAKELLHKTAKQTTSFEEFLRELLKNRVVFLKENKAIFQVLIKEVIYKEELKKELIPYFVERVLPLYESIVDTFKEQGELKDLPTERILKTLLPLIVGFFVTRFVIMDNDVINEEEIEDIVQLAMNGLKNNQ